MQREVDADTSALASASTMAHLCPPTEEGMEALANLEDFLLPNADLTEDLTDVNGALGVTVGRLAPDGDATLDGKNQEGLLPFDWDSPQHPLRNSTEVSWTAMRSKTGAEHMETHGTDKGRAETGDSSEWDQTHEQLGGLPVMKQTDSPESALMGGTSQQTMMDDSVRGLRSQLGMEEPYAAADSYGHRSGDLGLADGLRLPVSQPQYVNYQAVDAGRMEAMNSPMMWDRRSGGGSGVGGFYSALMEPELRTPGQRGFWMDDPAGVERAPAAARINPLYRMRSDAGGQIRERSMPPRRQYSAELSYEANHRGMEFAALDSPLESGTPFAHADPYSRMSRMHGLTPGGRGMMGSAHHASRLAPAAEAPYEASRKRTREAYLQQADFGSAQQAGAARRLQSRGHNRSHEERLILTLKRQIAALDPSTRSVLKESLYRISRNTNARVNGGGEGVQHRSNTRTSSLDRVVANLMYNRFEPHMRPAGLRQSTGWVTEPMGAMGVPLGGGRRSAGSPVVGTPGSHMEGSTG